MMFFQIISLFALLQKYCEEILEAQSNYSLLDTRAKCLQKLRKTCEKLSDMEPTEEEAKIFSCHKLTDLFIRNKLAAAEQQQMCVMLGGKTCYSAADILMAQLQTSKCKISN